MQGGDSSAEEQLSDQITRLDALASCTNLEQMQAQVHAASARLGECLTQLRAEKNAVIAELQSEIRTLHRSLEDAQRAATVDEATGMLRRSEFERMLRRDAIAGAEKGVIHIWLRDLDAVSGARPRPVVEQLLSSFAKRLKNVLPRESAAGRWKNDVFCVTAPKGLLGPVCARVATACANPYVCLDHGSAVTLAFRATATVLLRREQEDADEWVTRLDRLPMGE
jgi:GGDEF domain-containing protein